LSREERKSNLISVVDHATQARQCKQSSAEQSNALLVVHLALPNSGVLLVELDAGLGT
jgi:hypothetical protein